MNCEASSQQCQCGEAPAPDALWGLCGKCLLELTLSAPDTAVAESSRQFGGYELGRQIGRGGMGVVYHAVQASLRRPVALKVILDAEVATPQARRRFNIEAEAAARLDHPNIVPIYEFGECEGQPFLSMKLIQGETLREKIVSGNLCLQSKAPLSRAEAHNRAATIVRLVARVARAVHHAHEHGVLHRDLKPGNILVDPEGQPHLTDFGLAKICEPDREENSEVSSETAVGGTPRYMSPEHAAGKCLTAASDIYSLGAVFYEMLTSAPPFKGCTVVETLRMIADDAPKGPRSVNPHIEKDLETICLKCLEKNPDARYPSAAALAEDLERWLRAEPIQARPTGWILRTVRWTQRNRLGAAFIASLCACLALALVLLKNNHDKNKAFENLQDNAAHEVMERINDLWENPTNAFVHVSSVQLAQMMQSQPRPRAKINLTLGVVINQNPFAQAHQYAPVLEIIERRMEKNLGYPVRIDLRLYKHRHEGGRSPVALGEVDFQRLGPLRYVQARAHEPRIQLLVRETPEKKGVIFAKRDSGITTLNGVRGRKVAFADTNSTISFLTKAYLFQAGIKAHDLKEPEHLDVRTLLGPEEFGDSEIFSHKEVLRRVQKGDFEVGECSLVHFERNHQLSGRELVLLKDGFPVPPDVIVAKARLHPRLADAFQDALCWFKKEKDLTLLRRIRVGNGYEPASDSDYNTLRSLADDVRKFEASH